MRLLICGSRNWPTSKPIRDYIQRERPEIVITGGAGGVDNWAEVVANHLGINTIICYPDWETNGRSAGPIRNHQMLDLKPDKVAAFWDGESRGTAHMIGIAEKAGVPVEVFLAEDIDWHPVRTK